MFEENFLTEPLLKDANVYTPISYPETPLTDRINSSTEDTAKSKNNSDVPCKFQTFEYHHVYCSIVSITFTVLSIGFIGISFWFPWSTVSSDITTNTLLTSIDFNMNMYYSSKSFHEIIPMMYPYQLNSMNIMMLTTAILAPVLCLMSQLITIFCIRRMKLNCNRINTVNDERNKPHSPINFFIDTASYDTLSNIISFGLILANVSMTPIYIHLLLNEYYSKVNFRLENIQSAVSTNEINQDIFLQTRTQINGVGVSYMVGLISGVFSLFVLKCHLNHCKYMGRYDFESNERGKPNHNWIVSPPPVAFQFMHHNCEQDPNNLDYNRNTLIENINCISDARNQESDFDSCVGHEDETVVVRNANTCENSDSVRLLHLENKAIPNSTGNLCYRSSKTLSFETGLIASLLFIPAMTCPILKIRYGGILAPVMDQNTTMFYSYSKLVYSIVTQNEQKGVLIVISKFIIFLWAFFLPILVWIASSMAWFLCLVKKEKLGARLIVLSKCFGPLASLSMFGFATLSTGFSLHTISYHAFDGNVLCQLYTKYIDLQTANCADISASFEPMIYLFLIRAISTDIFLASIFIR